MSSFNVITKMKYTGNTDELITLTEYIIFQDDKARKKYIVFNFLNNVTQQLLGMQFEVSQYNAEGNLIEKSVVIYNKFLAGAEEAFVPKAKLRVSYYCDTISIRLIQAAYDRFVWNEGEYEDNSYKFDHFFHDEQLLADEKKPKKLNAEKVKKEKQPKKKKEKRSKHPFIMRDATKKNLSKLPAFFNVVAFLAVIAFVLTSLLIFKNDTKKFTSGDYVLRVTSESENHGKTVAVCGYIGSETQLVIPEKLGDYTVNRIDGNSFVKSNITSVTIDAQFVTIAEGAFKNCAKLTEVKSTKSVYVLGLGFEDCINVSKVTMPLSTLAPGAFKGSGLLNESNLMYSNSAEVTVTMIITGE